MEKHSMFMVRKNQYYENVHTAQSNLQIQCYPHQASNDLLHRTGKTTLNFIQNQKIAPIAKSGLGKKNMKNLVGDSRWCSENNPGLKLSVNVQRVSQGRISRRIFVAHRTRKFPGIGETRDASAAVLAGAACSQSRSAAALHSAPHKAHWPGCPVEPAI